MSHSKPALERAIAHLGGVNALARALGVQSQAVSQWRSGATSIGAERAVQIETATAGAVLRSALRPDLFAAPVPVAKRRASRR